MQKFLKISNEVCHRAMIVKKKNLVKHFLFKNWRTVNVRNPDTFGFQTIDNGLVVKLLGFRTFVASTLHCAETKLDHFIYNFFLYLKWSRLMQLPKSERKVRISDRKYCPKSEPDNVRFLALFRFRTFGFQHSTVYAI